MNARQKAKYYKRLLNQPLPEFKVETHKIDTLTVTKIFNDFGLYYAAEDVKSILLKDLLLNSDIEKYIIYTSERDYEHNEIKVRAIIKVVNPEVSDRICEVN